MHKTDLCREVSILDKKKCSLHEAALCWGYIYSTIKIFRVIDKGDDQEKNIIPIFSFFVKSSILPIKN
jgi:hypothetical protein